MNMCDLQWDSIPDLSYKIDIFVLSKIHYPKSAKGHQKIYIEKNRDSNWYIKNKYDKNTSPVL